MPRSNRPALFAAIEDIVRDCGDKFALTRGRKVLEIRPTLNWNKGTALAYLTRRLSEGNSLNAKDQSSVSSMLDNQDLVPIYLGDDR